MKKIRLANDQEFEVYNISEANNVLAIEMLDADVTELQSVFSVPENLTTIQYIIGTDVIKGFSGYTTLVSIVSKEDQLISIDYSVLDPDTPSGFKEERATVVAISLKKNTCLEDLAIQVAENTANIAYLMMMIEPVEE